MRGRATLPIAASLAFATALLFAADRVLQPVPVSALTATAGAFIGVWLLPRPARAAGLGLAVGLALGVSFHMVVHASGGSPSPGEGFAAHLLADAALGGGIALAAMLPALAGRLLR
jgi:hypothetical protein